MDPDSLLLSTQLGCALNSSLKIFVSFVFKAFLFSGIIHNQDLLIIFLNVYLFLAPFAMLASFENDNSILSPTLLL